MIDKQIVILNDGDKEVRVLVYLKEVRVRNNFTNTKAYCRMI